MKLNFIYNIINSMTISPDSIAFRIEDIQTGRLTRVTSDRPNDYQAGQQIIFSIPKECGIQELDRKIGYIVSRISEKQFSIDIDSSTFDAFNPPPFYSLNPATIIRARETLPESKSKPKRVETIILPSYLCRLGSFN